MLELCNLVSGYGRIRALKGVSLKVPAGSIVTLIGANGAGKSTLLRTVMGLNPAMEGKVLFEGRDVTKMPTHRIVSQGISLVPEGRQILESMTVAENLEMGAYLRSDSQVAADLEAVYQRFPILYEKRSLLGGTLSGGQQQMLAIGRALMGNPKLLLLDEPSMGLAPLVVQEIFDVVQDINRSGTTVLLIEQNAKKALAIADYAYVLETGKMVMEGPAQTLASDPRVREAYLGGSVDRGDL